MPNPAEQFHIIVNPEGAGGRTGVLWERLAPVCEASGRDVHVRFSTRAHGITQVCNELTSNLSEGDINIIVVGSDGAMNEALNGISDYGHVQRLYESSL